MDTHSPCTQRCKASWVWSKFKFHNFLFIEQSYRVLDFHKAWNSWVQVFRFDQKGVEQVGQKKLVVMKVIVMTDGEKLITVDVDPEEPVCPLPCFTHLTQNWAYRIIIILHCHSPTQLKLSLGLDLVPYYKFWRCSLRFRHSICWIWFILQQSIYIRCW